MSVQPSQPDFYKIANPKLQEFIEAIESFTYFTMEQLEARRNQIRTYFQNEMREPCLSFVGVTNTGGYPIIFDLQESEMLDDILDAFDYDIEDREHDKELIYLYAKEL